jgi:hypothetical protein
MKKRLALAAAAVSGLYLLTAGLLPDPLPFIDEALMGWILVKSLGVLGYDVRSLLPFLPQRGAARARRPAASRDMTIDV